MTWRQKPLREQVVLITGATSGIGLATARQAAAQGASVMLVARNEIALRSAVAAIEQIGGLADWAVADVGDPKAVGDAANKAVARFGRIDTWVNNAGVAIFAKLLDTPDAEHLQLFRTNYFGTVNGCRVATSHMRTKGGTLITIGSIASEIPSPMMGAYAASKHAIKGFVDSLRIEVEADKLPIIVTLIKPSGMNTPIVHHAANHQRAEARVAPPIYDPMLVADAILDAAERPHREITVGGTGKLQTLLNFLFPSLLARFGGAMIPLLSDPSRLKTPDNNLSHPMADGQERSSTMTGRTWSVYSFVDRRLPRGASFAIIGLIPLALGAGLLQAYRQSHSGRSGGNGSRKP